SRPRGPARESALPHGAEAPPDEAPRQAQVSLRSPDLQTFQDQLHERVLKELSEVLRGKTDPAEKRRVLEEELRRMIRESRRILSPAAQNDLIAGIADTVLGFGPLEPLLRDESVTEIMVNGPERVFIERAGRVEKANVSFRDEDHIRTIIDRIVGPIGRRIDESSPLVDARLPDGSRVNAVIRPLAVSGPSVSIRKFARTSYRVEDLVARGTLTDAMAAFLRAAVQAKQNILISGGTGSGKTTTLNALSYEIPLHERIVTVEDSAELQLKHPNMVNLETKPPNVEGRGGYTIRDLVKNALRMRPDRIVVGECRGGEALDMLQAMNTGHEGSLTTAHANSPSDAIARVETMVLMSGVELPLPAVRRQISAALDLIVQQSRLLDGSRKITHVSEVAEEDGDIAIHDIFRFEQRGLDAQGKVVGDFVFTGHRPAALQKMKVMEIALDERIFAPA
ncbi:MAG: CpaF family protein, partial [Chloroflexi bacterium]|nr:CpaF family protein [Chloroflexota bacterium]